MDDFGDIGCFSFCIALTVTVVLLCSLCSDNEPRKPVKWESAGVVISSEGWMKNTNDHPVRIKHVYIFRGEETKWFKVLQPGQRIGQSIYHQYGFYILTMDGVEIGYIHTDRSR